jgi:hypothetical protein
MICHKVDAFLMTKVGLNWPRLSPCDQWQERVIGKLQNQRSIFAHNATKPHTTGWLQYGGGEICCTNKAVHHVIATGKDPSHLGCWAWAHLQANKA